MGEGILLRGLGKYVGVYLGMGCHVNRHQSEECRHQSEERRH